MFTTINIILGLILLSLTLIIIVKKIFIEINGIDRGLTFLVIIAIGVVGVLCSLFALFGASSIHEQIIQVNKDKSMLIETSGIDELIAKEKTVNIIYLLVGYTTLIFDYIIYKIMKREYKQQQEQAKAKIHWDLNKLI